MKLLLLVITLIGVVAAQRPTGQNNASFKQILISMQRQTNKDEEAHRRSGRSAETERDGESQASIAMIKKKCDEYGHAGAFEDVQRALGQVKSCVQDAVKDVQFSYNDILQVIRYGCSVAPRMGRCLINLGEAVKPCMPPKRRESFQLANFTHDLISFACDNDGARVHSFIMNDGPECFTSNAAKIKECAAKYDNQDVVNSLENSIESGEVSDFQCKQSTDLRKCVEGKLLTCPNPNAVLFFKDLMAIAEKYSPCNQPPAPVMPQRKFVVQQTCEECVFDTYS